MAFELLLLFVLAGRRPKPHHISNGSPDLGIKKKSREGKGMLFREEYKYLKI